MKIYVSHASSYDYENELYQPLRDALGDQYELFFPHDTDNVSLKTKDVIADSDLVLAEVSLPSTGQGIELGWADAQGTKILCIKKAGVKTSSSLQFVTDQIIEYADSTELAQKLKARLFS